MPPRFSVFIATSLDGYIARADGALDWLELVAAPGESHGYEEFMASIDTMVVGRTTYETALGFPEWPYTGKHVIVLTHRAAAAHPGVELYAGSVTELAARLGEATRVYVDGGKVISQFLAAELIDDLTISVLPIVLGSGLRLFSGGEGEHRLALEGHRSWPSGLVQLRYQRVMPG
ncbi:MAG: dihydrofolate reductase [Myxococcales bacterium]|nr:dihydrofolate reductase [Myxococcales bacterium]